MIPEVAASEMGRAKTFIINLCSELNASFSENVRAGLGLRDRGVADETCVPPRDARGVYER